MVSREEMVGAYFAKENSEIALANLEEMKANGSIDEAEYAVLQAKHHDINEKARQTLKSLRIKLRKEFNSKSKELEECKAELSLLDTGLNSKKIPPEIFHEKADILEGKIKQLETELPKIELLINSRSSADLGAKTSSSSTMDAEYKQPGKMLSEKGETVVPVSGKREQASPSRSGEIGKVLRRYRAAIAVAGICVIGLIIWGAMALRETPYVCPVIGNPAPEITLNTVDGQRVSLSDYNNKIVMLYFWNFDCPPCDREIWNVMAVYDKWAKRDFVVLAINEKDSALTAREYAANRKLPFPVLLDAGGEMRKQYCLPDSLPFSIIIDADGTINTIKTGAFEGTEPLERIVSALAVKKGIDIEPPQVTSVAVSSITEESVVITWVTNEPATTQVVVSVPEGFPSPKADLALLRNHSVTLNGLKPVAAYQFKIVARDGSGNETILADKSQAFTTLASIPIGTEIGKRAPDFTVQTLDGKTMTLSDLKGKVVMVNFWSKTCSSCLREIPHMQEVYDKKLSDKFVMLAIHVTDGSADVKDFVAKWKITFPVLLDIQDKASTSYKLDHYPMTYFVDGQGIIRMVQDGMFNSPAEIDSIVNAMLKKL
jgi:peroxiredoxin